jgi:hypothetical protein
MDICCVDYGGRVCDWVKPLDSIGTVLTASVLIYPVEKEEIKDETKKGTKKYAALLLLHCRR